MSPAVPLRPRNQTEHHAGDQKPTYFGVRRQLGRLLRADLDRSALRLGVLLLQKTDPSGIAVAALPVLSRELGITRWPLRRALDTLEAQALVKVARLRAGDALPDGRRLSKMALRITFLEGKDGATAAPFDPWNGAEPAPFDPEAAGEDGAELAPFDPWNGAEPAPFFEAPPSSDLTERVNPPPTPSPSAASVKPPAPPGGPPGPPPGAPPHGGESDAPSAPAPSAPLWSRAPRAERSAGSPGAAGELRGSAAFTSASEPRPNVGRAATKPTGQRAPEIEKSQVRRARADVPASDAARNVIARWSDAIGWRSAELPAEWLKFCERRLADCGPDAVELAMKGATSAAWYTNPERRGWARLPGYVLRSADRTIAAAEAGRDAVKPAPVRPKEVPPPPAPTREAIRAQAPHAQALFAALEPPATTIPKR